MEKKLITWNDEWNYLDLPGKNFGFGEEVY